MANTIELQTIVSGVKNTVVKLWLKSDGSTGDIINTTIFDASAQTPAFTDIKIMRVQGALSGFNAYLTWDATTDVQILALPNEHPFDYDYRGWLNGIPSNAGTGKTGDIFLSTQGFTAATDIGFVILWVQRHE